MRLCYFPFFYCPCFLAISALFLFLFLFLFPFSFSFSVVSFSTQMKQERKKRAKLLVQYPSVCFTQIQIACRSVSKIKKSKRRGNKKNQKYINDPKQSFEILDATLDQKKRTHHQFLFCFYISRNIKLKRHAQ